MTKRYFRVRLGNGYSFDSEVVGKTFEGVRVNENCVALRIPEYHGGYHQERVWNFAIGNVVEVSGKKPARKKVRAPKQTPPAPKQRKLHIRYATGEDYHLKNVTGVVVDTRSNELKVTYNEDREGTEFRINFTVPFADLTAIHFQDKVSKVSVGYFFEDGELVHRVEHFSEKPGVFQH